MQLQARPLCVRSPARSLVLRQHLIACSRCASLFTPGGSRSLAFLSVFFHVLQFSHFFSWGCFFCSLQAGPKRIGQPEMEIFTLDPEMALDSIQSRRALCVYTKFCACPLPDLHAYVRVTPPLVGLTADTHHNSLAPAEARTRTYAYLHTHALSRLHHCPSRTARPLGIPGGKKVVQVACGGQHCTVVTSDGEVSCCVKAGGREWLSSCLVRYSC